MTIPQVQGLVRNLGMVALGATAAALVAAAANGELTGWSTLLPALEKYSFTGFLAALAQIVGWIGQSSPMKP